MTNKKVCTITTCKQNINHYFLQLLQKEFKYNICTKYRLKKYFTLKKCIQVKKPAIHSEPYKCGY